MLEAMLTHLHNWFPARNGKHAGAFVIASGVLSPDIGLVSGQYYRIKGSVFNDGLHRAGDGEALTDETFTGEVWALAIPPAVIKIAEEITAWEAANAAALASPYQSESFGGYSYTKAETGGSGAQKTLTWRNVYAAKLARWRKL